MSDRIRDLVWSLAEEPAKNVGVSIWDVEFQKEGGEYYLRVYIDRVPDGVTSDDCENIASQLNPLLDEADPIDHSYIFEVSSPGIERKLRLPEHYQACIGETVRVKCYQAVDGQKQFVGTLESYRDGDIVVRDGEGAHPVEKKNIALCRIEFDFEG